MSARQDGAAPPAIDTPEPLEALFGDPLDPDNPLGFEAFLAADERGDLLTAGRTTLDFYGLGAEFVPRAEGGRLVGADRLAQLLRPIFRRDCALGLGHGAINLIASAPVWAAGDKEQRRWVADALLRGAQSCGAYTDLASGHDLANSSLRAERSGNVLRLAGRKEMINNVAHARSMTLLVRTGDEDRSRSHSLLVADMSTLPRRHIDYLPRYRTAGMRAVHLSGVRFRDCPVPESAVLGEPGGALETVLRAFQVTKAVLIGATLGAFDTQLRTVTRFAVERRIYDRRVADLDYPRALLAGAFTDLLISDCLATVVCRALHLLPRQTSMYAAAAKYLVPVLALGATEDLATVLGARSFLREGPHAIFQKHLRDLPVGFLAHSGATVCQATIIPQLTRMARKSWLATPAAPAELFRLDVPMDELDFGRIEIIAAPDDALMATLVESAEELRGEPELGPLCRELVLELERLRAECLGLSPRDRTPLAGPDSFEAAERYTILIAAACCLGVWRHNRDRLTPFLRETAWLTLALSRLAGRLGRAAEAADGCGPAVFDELIERTRESRAFDLTGGRIC